jgi:hypothetical protein
MIKALIKVIRAAIIRGVIGLPLKKESRPEIKVKVKGDEVCIGFLDRRNSE